jgi:hypothetical protein
MNALAPVRCGAPDLIEAVVGFRQWRLAARALTSLYGDVPWPRDELHARCMIGDHDPTDVPANACSCGIYAYYHPCPRTASAATSDLVGGVVALWGHVELHATGMRAEHARIIALELPLSRGRKRRSVVEVAESLGVVAVPHRDLKAVAADHGSPLQRSLRPSRSWATDVAHQPISIDSAAIPSAPRHSNSGASYQQIGVLPWAVLWGWTAARNRSHSHQPKPDHLPP